MWNKENPRGAYGQALVALVRQDERLYVLDADLYKATGGIEVSLEMPQRHVECGIAEQNMVSVAGGMAHVGLIPIVQTFSVFLAGRAYDQIRVCAAYAHANIKLIGTSAGFSNCKDGATHQSIEDVTLLCALPNMAVFVPCDARQTVAALKACIAMEGPCYLRICRADIPVIYAQEKPLVPGTLDVLLQGEDAVIFANGIMVSRALEAAEMLALEGVRVTVANAACVKPFAAKEARMLARQCRGNVIIAQENVASGGLTGAVHDALKRERDMAFGYVCIEDRFGQSAHSYEELLEEYGLTAEHVVQEVKRIVESR